MLLDVVLLNKKWIFSHLWSKDVRSHSGLRPISTKGSKMKFTNKNKRRRQRKHRVTTRGTDYKIWFGHLKSWQEHPVSSLPSSRSSASTNSVCRKASASLIFISRLPFEVEVEILTLYESSRLPGGCKPLNPFTSTTTLASSERFTVELLGAYSDCGH